MAVTYENCKTPPHFCTRFNVLALVCICTGSTNFLAISVTDYMLSVEQNGLMGGNMKSLWFMPYM